MHAHVESRTFTNREGATVTRNRAVLDETGHALLSRALPMIDAVRGALPIVEVDEGEARDLRFGRRIACPAASRRSRVRCAPQPNRSPRSRAKARMYVPAEALRPAHRMPGAAAGRRAVRGRRAGNARRRGDRGTRQCARAEAADRVPRTGRQGLTTLSNWHGSNMITTEKHFSRLAMRTVSLITD